MAKSAAERQREWKARQRVGGKKPVTVMLSKEAHKVLEEEKNRTGEKYPDIIERAVLNLENKDKVTSNNKTAKPPLSIPVTSNEEAYRAQIINRIFSMKDESELSFGEIARRFNEEGIETFSGKGKWHGKTISKMYWKEKKP